MSKKDEPIICPLLSIACPTEEEFTNCMKEACWFYSRKMKMCAIVIQALAVSNINMRQVTEVLKGEKEGKMQSLQKQHRATEE